MCGIAGFYAKNPVVSSAILEQMTLSLSHRGPDDQGFYGVENDGTGRFWKKAGEGQEALRLGLGFRRLSILDLSELAAQPMRTDDGRYWMVFNGLIYNYVELREQLKDFRFRSSGDTEVLLKLFAKEGIEGLRKLNGIFAFAIFDTQTRRLWIVRDPFGIKPLYYFIDERGLFFGSEIRALLKARNSAPSLRLPLLSRYLMTNWIPDPETLFDGIQKLEPGHYLSVSENLSVDNHCYWDMEFQSEGGVSLKQWTSRLDEALQHVVDRQLRSDVPVGFFLSGGIDSSLLAVRAEKLRKDPPATFTVGFQWSHSKTDDLDLHYARLLKEKFPFQYNELILSPSIVSVLPKVVDSLEEPLADPAAICSYLICEAASKKYKVLISGQGGDELFGGYPSFQAGIIASDLQTALPQFARTGLAALAQHMPYSFLGTRSQSIHRIKKLLLSSTLPWPSPYMFLRSALGGESLQGLLTPDALAVQEPPFARHLEHFEKAKSWDRWHQMMYLDIKTYLPCLNLLYSDKTSMAHSVELRVPFLDMEIAELVQSVPHQFKANLTQTKILLKSAAKKVLPESIIRRKKAGFGLPIRDWFLKDLQPMAEALFEEGRLRRQNLFQPATLSRWLREHREQKADHSFKLYSLMTFQLWCDAFGIR